MGRSGEGEILCSIGSRYKIDNVYYDSNITAWRIEMTAIDQEMQSIRDRHDLARNTFGNCNNNLLFGRLLLKPGQYVKAQFLFSNDATGFT